MTSPTPRPESESSVNEGPGNTPPPAIIDTHAHVDATAFDEDRDAVLERAREAGVRTIVSIGIDLESCRKTLRLADEHRMIRPALGIHPNEPPSDDEDLRGLEAILDEAKDRVVAIGETGLDTYRDTCPLDVQERRFRRHIALARERGLPIIIHCREAMDEVLRVLRDEAFGHGVLHCFGGTPDHVGELVELGMHVSFAGNVTYKTAESLREAARVVPLDRLLLETDAPFLAPVPKRGKRNEPAFTRHTSEFLAETRGEKLNELAAPTTANAEALFGLAVGH